MEHFLHYVNVSSYLESKGASENEGGCSMRFISKRKSISKFKRYSDKKLGISFIQNTCFEIFWRIPNKFSVAKSSLRSSEVAGLQFASFLRKKAASRCSANSVLKNFAKIPRIPLVVESAVGLNLTFSLHFCIRCSFEEFFETALY